ncbi:PorT family protein [bacterium]|nr:PorT family protein [bacterium]
MKQRTSILLRLVLPVLALLLLTAPPAMGQMPFRFGVQLGMMGQNNQYSWVGASDGATTDVHHQNGYFGIVVDYSLSDQWQMEFSPRYGQRAQLQSKWDNRSGVRYSFTQGTVDYLAIPMLLRYSPFSRAFVRPYLAGGIEFGMNLSNLGLRLTEYRFSEEPPLESHVEEEDLFMHQLFAGSVIELGTDIRASADWSVLFGLRYEQELTPLLENEKFTWESPWSWQVRLALLYTIDQ